MKKVDMAREAFEAFKSQGLKATKSSVATHGKVSRSLLTPDKGKYKSEEWERLANEIVAYQASDKSTKIGDRYRNKIQELRNARDEIDRKYRAQVAQNTGFCAEMVQLRRESADLMSAYKKVVEENDNLQNQCSSCTRPAQAVTAEPGTVTPLGAAIRISTDNELMSITGGKYKWDTLTSTKAHNYARKKLREALSRSVAKRLYLLIGRPGAGKTSWMEAQIHPPFSDGLFSVYYDATNATIAARWEIMEIARESTNTRVCFVYFDTDVMVCIANSQKRKEKIIPENVIRDFQVEPPKMKEGYDDLIIVNELKEKSKCH